MNLGNIGLYFGGVSVKESDLTDKSQVLDLWTGSLVSTFIYNGTQIRVETRAAADSDTVGISIESELLSTSGLGLFFDFPYSDVNKFDAPYVGVWNATSNHSTSLQTSGNQLVIQHTLDDNSYFLTAAWEGQGQVVGPQDGTHRYFFTVPGSTMLRMTATFSSDDCSSVVSLEDLVEEAESWWEAYWTLGAFIDLTSTTAANATELQRRIILSQYLLAVNSASSFPPQESGLVNNGWYGKFHVGLVLRRHCPQTREAGPLTGWQLEQVFWHLMHFARWNHFDLLSRSVPGMYRQFLPSSYDRAKRQGYKGARWGKMTDPTGQSAPGEINSLLVWQQPHPMYFAEIEYRSSPNDTTLEAWDEILTAAADFMASFAFYNETRGVYVLGPPLYPVSETGNPNVTINPTFELAYWRFGLDIAMKWKERQGKPIPVEWAAVRDRLAPLPVVNDTYPVWEGIPNMWTDNSTTYDVSKLVKCCEMNCGLLADFSIQHPAMAGIYGWLPPPMSGPPLNLAFVQNTADKILELWDLKDSYGWDFSLLAMNSLRLGNVDQALAYLLDPVFQFDDAGYPVGGSRVPTPYFPNAASLLLATAMMAGGWDGSPGPHFPEEWDVRVEGFVPGL